ncbi:10883_t:CDS:2, partial [Funneliformis geosporum]
SSLNLVNPIQRDTATIPKLGWLKIRFTVDNPGVWPMHCHIDWHLSIGMLAQFVEFPKAAREAFDKKAPFEWCESCTAAKNPTQYCANKIR